MPGTEGTTFCQGLASRERRILFCIQAVCISGHMGWSLKNKNDGESRTIYAFIFWAGFFPKLAHNLSFPWTTLVSKHFSGFYPQLYFSFSFSFSFFFFQVLGANIFQGGFDSSLLSFLCSSLPLYTNKSGSCLEPDDTLWLSQTSACFLQGGPCFGSEKSIPRQYLAALASLILLLYRSYSCIS